MTDAQAICEHCGLPAAGDGDIEHRACRMKAAFPGAYSQVGALVSFDMETIKAATGWKDPVETVSGLAFERHDSRIWVSLRTHIGNALGSWAWSVTEDEWTRIVAALPPRGTGTASRVVRCAHGKTDTEPCEQCGTVFVWPVSK